MSLQKIKQYLRKYLPSNRFARNASILLSGTASSQFLLIAASPLIARLYDPSDFGHLAIYSSLLSIVSIVASLRYQVAIPLPEDNDDAVNLAALSIFLALFTGGITAFLVFGFGNRLTETFNFPEFSKHLWLVPIGVTLAGVYSVFNYYAIRQKNFQCLARTRLFQTIGIMCVQLAGFKFGVVALLVGHLVGQTAGTRTLVKSAIAGGDLENISLRGVKRVAIRYRRFPLFSTLEGLGTSIGTHLPPILFASMFGATVAGAYSLTNRVLQVPMLVIGYTIGQVFLAEAAEASRNGSLNNLISSLHSILARIGMAPSLLLILFGPEIFVFTFGENWLLAGEFSRWMAPWIYLYFVSSPLSTLFAVIEKQGSSLAFHAVLLVSRISSIFLGSHFGDFAFTMKLFAATNAVCWLGYLIWIAWVTGISFRAMIQPSLLALLTNTLCLSPIIFFQLFEFPFSPIWTIPIVLSGTLIGGLYYQLISETYYRRRSAEKILAD